MHVEAEQVIDGRRMTQIPNPPPSSLFHCVEVDVAKLMRRVQQQKKELARWMRYQVECEIQSHPRLNHHFHIGTRRLLHHRSGFPVSNFQFDLVVGDVLHSSLG